MVKNSGMIDATKRCPVSTLKHPPAEVVAHDDVQVEGWVNDSEQIHRSAPGRRQEPLNTSADARAWMKSLGKLGLAKLT